MTARCADCHTVIGRHHKRLRCTSCQKVYKREQVRLSAARRRAAESPEATASRLESQRAYQKRRREAKAAGTFGAPRKCADCSAEITGDPRRKCCPPCAKNRNRESTRLRMRAQYMAKPPRFCAGGCGITVSGPGRRKRCPECSKKHKREYDAEYRKWRPRAKAATMRAAPPPPPVPWIDGDGGDDDDGGEEP